MPAWLLSVIYLVFGLNFFFHFIPLPPATGSAGNFIGILFTSNLLLVVKVLEVLLAVMLLVPASRALALLLLAPITLNILLFELLIVGQPGIGLLLLLLNILAIYLQKEKYYGIVGMRLPYPKI